MHFCRLEPGHLGLSLFTDEAVIVDSHVSSTPVCTVTHPLTLLESLLIFSNEKIVSNFDHSRSNYYCRKVLSPIKISCANEILFLDKLCNWLDF